jgi:hypothetical protein
MPGSAGKRPPDLKELQNMIQWFDGYAACYNADPFRIEKMVSKKKEEDAVSKAWSEIRPAVSDIITLPDSSEEIVSTQKKNRIYRPISAVMIFGSGLSLLLISGLHLAFSRLNLLLVLVVLLTAYGLVIYSWYRANHKLYGMVREYYRTHGSSVSRQRANIKAQAQTLIDTLTMTIRNEKLDPERFKLKLLHNDYSNIRVLKEESRKGADLPVYLSVVKARAPSKD